MCLATVDFPVHHKFSWLGRLKFEETLDINRPLSKNHYSELMVSFRLNEIIIEPFNRHAIDIFERLDEFFLTFDSMPVGKPGDITGLYWRFDCENLLKAGVAELGLALHLERIR